MSTQSELEHRWGRLGSMILHAGRGGGWVPIPDVLDDYERALGVSLEETWLLKRLLRNYWRGGAEVWPSLEEIHRQANISVPTLRKLRDSLAKKGLIKVGGRKGMTNGAPDNRVKLSLAPLFEALALCILCDPNSKIVKHDMEAKDEAHKRVKNATVPFSVEHARERAESLEVSLAWDEIAKMQNADLGKTSDQDKGRRQRQLELKRVVAKAAEGALSICWGYKRASRLLKWLVDCEIPSEDLFNIVRDYVVHRPISAGAQDEVGLQKHDYRAFEEHVEIRVRQWQEQRAEVPAFSGG